MITKPTLRIYPDLPLPQLLKDPFWWKNRMSQRCDDELPKPISAVKPQPVKAK